MPFARKAKADGKHVYHLNIGSEAILFALVATCDLTDEVVIPEPFYANYLGFSHMSAVTIRPLRSSFENQFALPSPSDFETLITSKTKAIFLCNPGNPTGQLYSREELAELMILVKKHDLFLIVDEVYREFCYDREFTSVLAFEGMEENVIVIDSISKVFSSCGARVGYLITKNKGVKQVVEKYAQLRLCPPFFGQKLAEACYENADQYIAEARAEYIRRRTVLYDSLSKIEGVECYRPQAAFYIICKLPVPDAEAFCKWLLSDFSYKNSTVMLAPAAGFYFTKGIGESQVRIAYVLKEGDLEKAVECLGIGLKTYAEEVLMGV